MSILTDIATYLQAQGYGTEGTNLWIGDMAETPDAATAVYGAPGASPEQAIDSTLVAENPQIQIVVRDVKANYEAAEIKARNIWIALQGLGATTQSGVRYYIFQALQSPFPMKRDANDRVYFACNYRAIRQLV